MFKKRISAKKLDLKNLDFDCLPKLTAGELFELLGQHNRLRSIQRMVGIDSARFEKLYLEPIINFCELAQLAPASTDYHHTGPGGLIEHTLSMIEKSVHERRKYNLPQRSDPEIQQHEKHAWTYAMFVGALLHDIGKLVTLCRFIANDRIISPYNPTSDSGSTYQIQFIHSPYKLHQYLSMSFYQIIPPLGQAFIADHTHILEELTGYFNDDPYSWGSVGEVVRQADQQSVAENIKLSKQIRFPSVPSSPLQERLITSLRLLIRNGDLPANRSGAAIWAKDDIAYVLMPRGVEMIREHLKENGATDIPSDNLRLYDALQQFGYVYSTPSDRAIWKINVRLGDGFNQTFTALKFDTKRLFHPSRQPKALNGVIIEMESDSADSEVTGEPITSHKNAGAENKHSDRETPSQPIKSAEADKSSPTANQNAQEKPQPSLNDGETTQAGTDNGIVEPTKDLGFEFIEWIKAGIESKSIRINEDQEIHIVNYKNREGETVKKVGVFSPAAFIKFAKTKELNSPKDFEIIQKAVHKTKLAIKNGRFHIHQYRIKNSTSSKALLRLYLFDMETLMPEGVDSKVNQSLVFAK